MSPRALVVSILTLATCLLLAVVMLAMLSAESDRSVIEPPLESFTAEMPGSPSAEPCEETVPRTQIVEIPEMAWISQC